jgi:hypothetical protein
MLTLPGSRSCACWCARRRASRPGRRAGPVRADGRRAVSRLLGARPGQVRLGVAALLHPRGLLRLLRALEHGEPDPPSPGIDLRDRYVTLSSTATTSAPTSTTTATSSTSTTLGATTTRSRARRRASVTLSATTTTLRPAAVEKAAPTNGDRPPTSAGRCPTCLVSADQSRPLPGD